MNKTKIADILETYFNKYNQPGFIENDPISIPHSFSKKQDIEIAGFFAAIFAWGQRITTINKCNQLMELMDRSPHDFILNHHPTDLKAFEHFKHRTFNGTDLLHFINFFQNYYQKHDTLESAFLLGKIGMKDSLTQFHSLFFASEYAPQRTKKHVANPARKSTCKRLNMFLRWMVRKDEHGVDLGIWKNIRTHDLMCPLDVHVDRTGRKLGLIRRKQRDWQTVEELTNNLKKFDVEDPVRFDFALFGMGLEGAI